MPEFRLLRGGIQDQFLGLRTKFQVFGGGFGNGKTTGAVLKAIQLGEQYPGMNALLARSTYPKLNDTLRKEFAKWCPHSKIDSFPMSVNASNTCTWKAVRGAATTFNFRYVSQQGKTQESTTSNLLSATYDLIVIDQMEDPEITYKDFLDLIGRLRGQALYRGDDLSMPRSGPRWLIMTCNPTRNWFYKKIVAPYHLYRRSGVITDGLLCIRDPETNKPIMDEYNKPILTIEIIEGGTDANAHNLPEDFITTMSSTYQGQMRDRFLKGEWAAYEGLVYPDFNDSLHMVDEGQIEKLLRFMRENGYKIRWVESYDFGNSVASCYLLGFLDYNGDVIVVDGFHKANYDIPEQAAEIKTIRYRWKAVTDFIYADPSIFRKAGPRSERLSDVFFNEHDLTCVRADNDIANGIMKVTTYLHPRATVTNPFTRDTPAPMIYFNEKLAFISEEIGAYYWKKSAAGDSLDVPVDGNDHAMDTIKYLLTNLPIASKAETLSNFKKRSWMRWHEVDAAEQRGM